MSALRVLAGRCRPAFEQERGLRAALLFGSVARGRETESSDIDVAVVGEGIDELGLGSSLSVALGREVDIVGVSYESPIPLLRALLRDARVLYERTPGQAADFLSRARIVNELDAASFDRVMKRFMERAAQHGVGR